MNIVPAFWQWLEHHGWNLAAPRPAFDPAVEQALVGEMQEEERAGEHEPVAVPDLSGGVRLIRRSGDEALLLVAESAMERGFWGVSVPDIAELRSQPLPWAVVLLKTGPHTGYWFEGSRAAKLAASSWRTILPAGPNYEVRETEETTQAVAFGSEAELQTLIDALAAKQG